MPVAREDDTRGRQRPRQRRSASRRSRCRASSTCSRRSSARPARAGRARHRPDAGQGWSRCTAAASRRRARARARAASSWCACRCAAARSRARPRSRRGAEGPRTQRILVVDDNQDAADTLARCCGMLGADVRVAHDGAAGAERARRLPADVGAARHRHAGHGRLRGRAAHPRQPGRRDELIALTGWGQARTAAHAGGGLRPSPGQARRRRRDASRAHVAKGVARSEPNAC